MDDFLNQGWFVLELACYRAKNEIVGHITLIVVILTVSFLFWVFLSPSVRKR